ncbi:hypothetical protein V8C40DRAFT_231493 [Trichoderma camerunense]
MATHMLYVCLPCRSLASDGAPPSVLATFTFPSIVSHQIADWRLVSPLFCSAASYFIPLTASFFIFHFPFSA